MKRLLITLSLASLSAFGQSTTVNTNETNLGSRVFDIIKPDRISHFSTFAGPSLDGNADPRLSNGDVDTDGPNSWHQVSFQYQLDKKTRFVINPRFTVTRSEQTGNDQAVGRLDNPVFGIQRTWYENGNFSFSGGLNTVLATVTDIDRERGLEWNPGGFQAANYKVNSRLNVGSWLWARYRYYRNAPDRSRAPLFVSPYITYSINDKLALQGFYQVNGQSTDIDTLRWDADEHLNFSFMYTINKAITLQPIITVFRDTDFDLNQGNINLWVSGRFL